MKKCKNWPIGVCNWSLQSGLDEVAAFMEETGLEHLHLDCEDGLGGRSQSFVENVRTKGWTVTSTMVKFPQEDYSSLEAIKRTGGIAPDDSWESNRDRVFETIEITADLGVPYLSTHIGFIDQSRPEYARKFHERVKLLADACSKKDVLFLMETGQESASELREFLEDMDHPALGVNFDPANMILYDKGDPIEAVRVLAPWIRHVHIKDGRHTETEGMLGDEVPWGAGEVGEREFIDVLREIGYEGALAIEREAGDNRFGDIKMAIEKLSDSST